ncbi:hypothetical protein [Micromonospora sp. HM5-17]|jgi:hypothetical protein|uniref:hypothetical protein n=1 Tax=Micromonospora sp. HM5-17 TaxID=2487710 RepID=UPI000F493DF3|nr:hypothetical protein [Micromonospora sp. HM5-17]ROT32390.1 hypothetical protein EF879_12620 [Micromonospora sp. HM5-17]
MDDPVLTAIVSALAGGAVAELTAGSRAAFKALVRLVRRKAAEHPDAENALLRAQQEPSDERRLAELHAMLTTAVLNDRAFAAELHRLWHEVRAGQGAGDTSQTSNTISGSVSGPVVQARDIHGGVHLGVKGITHD